MRTYLAPSLLGPISIYSNCSKSFGYVPWTDDPNGRGIFSPPTVERQWMQARVKVRTSSAKVDQKCLWEMNCLVAEHPRWSPCQVCPIMQSVASSGIQIAPVFFLPKILQLSWDPSGDRVYTSTGLREWAQQKAIRNLPNYLTVAQGFWPSAEL